MTSLRFELLV